MGINGFLQNLSIENYKNKKFDNVLIDCNYIIHLLIYKCFNDDDFKLKIKKYTDYLLKNVVIKKNIILIFDGIFDGDVKENPKLFKNRIYKSHVDYQSQPIRPKSDIVKFFKNTFISCINTNKLLLLSSFKIIVNDDYLKGEADLKIMDMLVEYKENDNCIISKDSDIILIASSCILKYDINIDIIINPNKMDYVIFNPLITKYKQDYILIILLLGNDYLPKISNIKYNLLLECYDKYINHNPPIIENNQLNDNNFREYFLYMINTINNNNGKLKFSLENLNKKKFNIYINNLKWCLSLYNIIEYNTIYILDVNEILNIYNLIYFL